MGNSQSGWGLSPSHGVLRTHRAKVIAIVAVAVTVVTVAAVLLLRGGGSGRAEAAEGRVAEFLEAWSAGDPGTAAGLTDDPEAAESLLESVGRNLGADETRLEISGGASGAGQEASPGAMAVPFTVSFDLDRLGEWTYESSAIVVPPGEDDQPWLVHWEPSLVYPGLTEEHTLVYQRDVPERAPVLAAGGSELAGSHTVWDVSVWPALLNDPDAAYDALDDLDAGLDLKALADRVTEADPDQSVPVVTLRDEVYQEHADALNAVGGLQFRKDTRPLAHSARSVVGGVDPDSGEGTSGLQARYDEQLAGTPESAVVIAERESGEAVEVLLEGEDAEAGTPVETTIDPQTQRAAEAAVENLDQDASVVAVQPSTGHVLAAADLPAAGLDLSMTGQVAPGSTFKVVTTAALLEGGMDADEVLGCPQEAIVDGQRFHNQNEFELGVGTTLHEVFTASCNTAYIENRNRFEDATLHDTAAAFGMGGDWDIGANGFTGSVPVADGANDLAASLIGQARVQASPLVMASVAATVAAGGFHQPVLVPEAVEGPYEAPAELSEGTYAQLRTMMRATVTEGTADVLRDVPGSVHAKTGTAEFVDEEGELSTHAWMIGYLKDSDLAFAVLLMDGGSGGSHAGPVAADFLNGLD